MKQIDVEIEGETPLLMCNAANMMDEKTSKVVKKTDYEKQADESAYWASKGKKELIIPAVNVYSMLIRAASGYKIRKKSAAGLLAGVLRITPDEIPLGTNKYEIDKRSVVVNRTARVIKARARLDTWKASFSIVFNEKYLPEEIATSLLKEILEEAGMRFGLMSFRPERRGWFGTFKITKWKA